MDEGVDEGGDLALDDEVAGRLKVGNDLSEASAELLDEVHDLLLGGVAGDELVNVGHDVNTDVACELIPGLREGGGAEDKEGETEESLHVEKSSKVQLRKEKIKASLNFFISFLPRDFKTLQNLTLNQFP